MTVEDRLDRIERLLCSLLSGNRSNSGTPPTSLHASSVGRCLPAASGVAWVDLQRRSAQAVAVLTRPGLFPILNCSVTSAMACYQAVDVNPRVLSFS